jgi:hypothetical protein
MKQKINLFVDADDTILNSSETIIDMLNEKYGIEPKKTVEDLADWNYRSIQKNMTSEEVFKMYDSEEFFERVQIIKDFENFIWDNLDNLNVKIISKGHPINLALKADFFKREMPYSDFIPLLFNECHSFDKSSVDMRGGIQIDDRTDCLLSTNASIKILITNGRKLGWNKIPVNEENFYVVQDWKEALEIINFCIEQGWMLS